MSWIFWVIALSWIVPFVMRRLGQPGPRGGRPPYRDRHQQDQYRQDQYRQDHYRQRPYRYGQEPEQRQYPGQNQYPGQPAPGPQYPPPYPQGQLPEGQSTAPQDPQTPWWQQPLPPGFPGQPAPQGQTIPQGRTVPPQQQPHQGPPQDQLAPAPSDAPPVPGDAPEGYRAKKLAELDRQFSDQKISLEEYMKARNEVMRG